MREESLQKLVARAVFFCSFQCISKLSFCPIRDSQLCTKPLKLMRVTVQEAVLDYQHQLHQTPCWHQCHNIPLRDWASQATYYNIAYYKPHFHSSAVRQLWRLSNSFKYADFPLLHFLGMWIYPKSGYSGERERSNRDKNCPDCGLIYAVNPLEYYQLFVD